MDFKVIEKFCFLKASILLLKPTFTYSITYFYSLKKKYQQK